VGEYSPAKIGECENCVQCKDLKDVKHNSLQLGGKCACIFVLGHYLFPVAHKQLKLGNMKTVCNAKIWRMINTIASIWGKMCLHICPWILSVSCSWEQIMSADKYPSLFSQQIVTLSKYGRGKKKWSEKMSTERFKNVTSCFVINLLITCSISRNIVWF